MQTTQNSEIQPRLELRRKASDPLPTLVLFGVSRSDSGLSAEAYHVHQAIKRPVILKAGRDRFTLPRLPFGFVLAPLELARA